MATRRDFLIGAGAVGLSPIVVSGTPGPASAAEGKMVLCIHTNTSAAAGYRGAFHDLLLGVNATLDAVLTPIDAAAAMTNENAANGSARLRFMDESASRSRV